MIPARSTDLATSLLLSRRTDLPLTIRAAVLVGAWTRKAAARF
jgi:hypothetical protein